MASSLTLVPQQLFCIFHTLDQIEQHWSDSYPVELRKISLQKQRAFEAFGKILSLPQIKDPSLPKDFSKEMREYLVHLHDKFYRLNRMIPFPVPKASETSLPEVAPILGDERFSEQNYRDLLTFASRLDKLRWSSEDQLRDHPISEGFFAKIKWDTFQCYDQYLLAVCSKIQFIKKEISFDANLYALEKYERIKIRILLLSSSEVQKELEIGYAGEVPLVQAVARQTQLAWLKMDMNLEMTGETKDAIKRENLHSLVSRVVPLLSGNALPVSRLSLEAGASYHALASAYMNQHPCLRPVFLQLMNYLA